MLALVLALTLQHPAAEPPRRAAADSVRQLRIARGAQSAFEAFRRARLPRGESHAGVCDVRIGRYCYWRGEDDDEKEPPEAEIVAARRRGLIDVLEASAELLPGDWWIAGQWVRYLVEARRTDAALDAARACRADAWWCSALAGYAAHAAGRFSSADSAYTVALGAMSDADRCRWLDVSEIVDDDLAKRARSIPCDARPGFARRLFWLAAPLLSVSTTDVMTEHFARLTRARMAEHSASVDGEYWAADERELVIRYGWPRWFTQTEPPPGSPARPSITGHDAGVPYYFFPALRAVDSTSRLERGDWTLDDARAPSGYAPSFARSVHDVPAQVAVFRRSDSARVVAAWDVRRDTTLVGRELDVSLIAGRPGDSLFAARGRSRNTGRISVVAPIDSGIVSLELLAAEDRRAGRVRVGFPSRARTRITLSDLLLHRPSASEETSLDAALDSALTSDEVNRARPVGVFWEAYGLAPQGETVKYTLLVEENGTSWIRRMARRAGIVDPSSALRIQWDETARGSDGIAPRGVRLDLSRLRPGRYRVELSVATADGVSAQTVRRIEVRDR